MHEGKFCHRVYPRPFRFLLHASDTCHHVSSKSAALSPLLLPSKKNKSLRLACHCLQINLISFPLPEHNLWWDYLSFFFLFFKQKQNSSGAWEKLLSEEIILMTFIHTRNTVVLGPSRYKLFRVNPLQRNKYEFH